MKKSGKCLAFLMAAILALSSTIPAFAIENVADGGDGNQAVGGGTDWGNDPGRSGIRISLVDATDPTKVVSIDKDGNPLVIDVIYGTEAQYRASAYSRGRAPKIFTGVKTQVMTTDPATWNPNNCTQIFINDYLEGLRTLEPEQFNLIGGANILQKDEAGLDDIAKIRWMFNFPGTATYTLRGKELRDWLISDKNGIKRPEIGNIDSIISVRFSLDDNGKVTEVPKSTEKSKRSTGATSKGTRKVTTTVKTPPKSDYNASVKEAIEATIELSAQQQSVIKQSTTTAELTKAKKSLYSWEQSGLRQISMAHSKEQITLAEYNRYKSRITDLYRKGIQLTVTQFEKLKNGEKQQSSRYVSKAGLAADILDVIFPTMTVYGATTNNDEIWDSTSSGDSGKVENTTGKEQEALLNHLSYILKFLDENGEPFIMTADTAGKTVMENGKERPMNVFDPLMGEHTVNFKVLVEPVDFFTPYHMDGITPIIPVRFYGTLTNIVQAFEVYGVNKTYLGGGWNNHCNRRTFNLLSWYAMTIAGEGEDEEARTKRENLFGGNYIFDPVGTTISGAGKSYKSGLEVVPNAVLYDSSLPYQAEDGATHQAGWGVHVYYPGEIEKMEGITTTWDMETYPTGEPGQSPEVPTSEIEKFTKTLKVAKWYYVYDELTETEIVTNVKVQELSGSPISITGEGNEDSEANIYWALDGWSTGTEERLPAQNDTGTTFEEYADTNIGSYAGTEKVQLTIEPTDPDKVLYVKLVQHTLPSKNVDIVKVFEGAEGTAPKIKVETGVVIPDTGYDATDPDGSYKEHMQTVEERIDIMTWDDIYDLGMEKNDNPIIKEDTTHTIYIRYGDKNDVQEIGDNKQIVLYEDELSHGYQLKSLRADGKLSALQEHFDSKDERMNFCGGYEVSHGTAPDDYTSTEYCSSKAPRIDDDSYTLAVDMVNNNPNFILDFAEASGDGTWSLSGTLGISGGDTKRLTPDAGYLLYRNRDKDLVTLYPGKTETSLVERLRALGIGATGATPQTTRIATEGHSSFRDTFGVSINEAGSYDRTLSWAWSCRHGSGSGTWDGSFVLGHSMEELVPAYNFENSVETRYELGSVGKGSAAPLNQVANDFGRTFYNNRSVKIAQDGDLKFYPYIEMNFKEKGEGTGSGKPVYVTSTNTSTIAAYTKIEAGVWKNGAHDDSTMDGANPKPNVNLSSTQWSTHKNSLKFMDEIGARDGKSVLPGGAIFDVSMNEADRGNWNGPATDVPTTSTKLGVRVWQTCIDDSRTGLLAPGSTAPTVSEAKAQVTALDNSIKATIPTYGLVQSISKGALPYGGYLGNLLNSDYSVVVSGGSWNGTALSSDMKYYLKLVEAGGAREFNSTTSNFDLLKGGIISQNVYTIGSTTNGEVYVKRDGTELGRITAGQSTSDLLAKNAEIKAVDSSTQAVSNYISAIDRNKGYSSQGKTWYNEAFDGIDVVSSYLSYDIGFGRDTSGSGVSSDGTATRSAVLDTKLTGKLDSKSDLYNFVDNKVNSSMFLTGQKKVGLTVPTGHIGALPLKNGSIALQLPDMNILAYSKMFYIPNANVTDLN